MSQPIQNLIAAYFKSMVIVGCCCSWFPVAHANITVAITQIVEHPSLNTIRQGIESTLLKSNPKIKIKYFNAQGDRTLATQIAHRVISEAPSVIVSISTPMSQAIIARKPQIPVVFTAVNDPLGARLVASLDSPGPLVTGVLQSNPVDRQLQLIKKILPQIKKIGVIYNAGEANSVYDISKFKAEALKNGITVIESTVSTSSQVIPVTTALVDKVEALYFPTDNTVVSAVQSVLKITNQHKIPVFAADSDSVTKGAIATITTDHFHLGEMTALLILKVLSRSSPRGNPVEFPSQWEMVLNQSNAKAIDLQLPADLLQAAQFVY